MIHGFDYRLATPDQKAAPKTEPFALPLFSRKLTVADAYVLDPAQMRNTHGEPVCITLSAVAVGISRGACFCITAGSMARVFSLEKEPRIIETKS